MNPGPKPTELDPAARARSSGDVPAGTPRLHQPKASLCLMLAILWTFPSVGAAFILGAGEAKWLQAHSVVEGLRVVAFEQWIALAILLAHPAFAGLAWNFRQTEPWKEIAPEPDPDLREDP